MKTEKNILLAFILNLSFSVFEFFGGVFSGSVAILSDAVHDLGDAVSIGISYFLERKSSKKPDKKHTYGYVRYSVMGSVVTTVILIVGSIFVIYEAIKRIINPVQVDYSKMLIFAIIGVIINSIATYITRAGDSLNQKAVNLHMLEDVLGWILVLIGAIVMRFTNLVFIDPILSICVALFILINAIKNLKNITNVFLEKTPNGIDINSIKIHLLELEGVLDVHHIHVWSIDGYENLATMHVVTKAMNNNLKIKIKEELKEYGIVHSTIEFETCNEICNEEECKIKEERVKSDIHNHKH